jgi:hypothetical protein
VYGPIGKAPKGAFWLHEYPATLQSRLKLEPITIIGAGTPEEYVRKQWGRTDIPSSFPRQKNGNDGAGRLEFGYDPHKGLQLLWGETPPNLHHDMILAPPEISRLANNYDLVFQTFAPPVLQPGRGGVELVRIPICWRRLNTAGNVVVYNGGPGLIVRSSFLFGYEAHELVADTPVEEWRKAGYEVEYRTDIVPTTAGAGAEPIRMPVALTDNIVLLGRYATGGRKVLSHEAYDETAKVLKAWKRGAT